MIAIIISFETIVEASSSCDDDGNHDGKTKKQVEVVVSQHQISTLHPAWLPCASSPQIGRTCCFHSDYSDYSDFTVTIAPLTQTDSMLMMPMLKLILILVGEKSFS